MCFYYYIEKEIYGKNKHYSVELKSQAVTEYLSGKSPMLELCKKYDIKEKLDPKLGQEIWIRWYEFYWYERKTLQGDPPIVKDIKDSINREFSNRV